MKYSKLSVLVLMPFLTCPSFAQNDPPKADSLPVYTFSALGADYKITGVDRRNLKIEAVTSRGTKTLNLSVNKDAYALLIDHSAAQILRNTAPEAGHHLMILDNNKLYILDSKQHNLMVIPHNYDVGPNGDRRNWATRKLLGGHTLMVFSYRRGPAEGFLITNDNKVFKIQMPERFSATEAISANYPGQPGGKLDLMTISLNGQDLKLEEMQPEIVKWDEVKAREGAPEPSSIPFQLDRPSAATSSAASATQEEILAKLADIPFIDEVTGATLSLADYLKKTFSIVQPGSIDFRDTIDQEQIDLALVGLMMSASGGVAVLGPAGTGKTYFMKAVASYAVSEPSMPAEVKNRLYLVLRATDFASNGLVGRFETKVKALKLASKYVPLTTLVDEIHTLVGQGTHMSQPNDFFELIKEEMADGQIKALGGTTDYDYETLAKSRAIDRRFPIKIKYGEPTQEKLLKILRNSLKTNTPEFDSKISEAQLLLISRIAGYFNAVGANPDKSIVLMDSMIQHARLKKREITDEFIWEWAERLYKYPVRNYTADSLDKKIDDLKSRLDRELIGLDEQKMKTYKALVDHFETMNQMEATTPFSALVFGDRGGGKTTFAKILGAGLGMEVERIMMSTFKKPEAFKEKLGRTIRENPFKILLLDEPEKTSQEVQSELLEILDDGKFETPLGAGEAKLIDATKTIFIIATNAGYEVVNRKGSLGELREAAEKSNLSRYLIDRASIYLQFPLPDGPTAKDIVKQKLLGLKIHFDKFKLEWNEDEISTYVLEELEKSSLGGKNFGFTPSNSLAAGGSSVRDLERVIKDIRREIRYHFKQNKTAKSVIVSIVESKVVVSTGCDGDL